MSENAELYYPTSCDSEQRKCTVTQGCSNTAHCYTDISASVCLKPYATVEAVDVKCCGDPIVCCNTHPSSDNCSISIEQKICINVAINYKVTAHINEVNADCNCACNQDSFKKIKRL